MKARDFNRLKKIAEERGGGQITKKRDRWTQIKKKRPRKNRAKSHPKITIGRTILVRDNEVL